MSIYEKLQLSVKNKQALYYILIDPDKISENDISRFLRDYANGYVDGFLVGGSLMMSGNYNKFLQIIKDNTDHPVIIFPGSVNQVSPVADAILFLSIISGRNPEHLIGKHVVAAPLIKNIGLEPISTGYMLIESGAKTTAEYFSGSSPIPRNKIEIAIATALAGEYLGLKLIYLEAGSGANEHIPFEMVSGVSKYISIPLIVGGGIREPKVAAKMVLAGANIVVMGNHLENSNNWSKISVFAEAVHNPNRFLATEEV